MPFVANTSPVTPNDPGFDEDSPDVADPGIDPTHPGEIPEEGPDVKPGSGVNDPEYPPFEK